MTALPWKGFNWLNFTISGIFTDLGKFIFLKTHLAETNIFCSGPFTYINYPKLKKIKNHQQNLSGYFFLLVKYMFTISLFVSFYTCRLCFRFNGFAKRLHKNLLALKYKLSTLWLCRWLLIWMDKFNPFPYYQTR